MKRSFAAGVLAGLVGGMLMLGLRPLVDAPTLQELIVERLLVFISPAAFEFLLQQVWSLGKTLAVIGVTLLIGGLGGVIGVAYAWLAGHVGGPRRPVVTGLSLGAALWLVSNLALLPLLDVGLFGQRVPGDDAGFQVLMLAGFGALGFTLAWALAGDVWASAAVPGDNAALSRRMFLARSVGWAVVIAGLGSGLRFLITTGAASMTAIAKFREDSGEMPSEITPVEQFYVVSKNLVDPDVSGASWRLSISGMFDRPFTLSLEELRALPPVEQIVTLECISNPVGGHLISNGRWTGVRLRDLLQRAGLQSGVTQIVFRAADGYDESLPLEAALRPEVMVVYDLNGEPLTKDHGFPARIIVPGRYGMKGPKWLEGISTSREPVYLGYWAQRGWDNDLFVKTTSQVIVPRALDPIVVGKATRAGGIAFSGDRGISRVEFSSDGGKSWSEARLTPALSPFTWVLWDTDWTPADAGQKTVVVRAYDADGAPQIVAEQDPAPSGATGLHAKVLFNVKAAK